MSAVRDCVCGRWWNMKIKFISRLMRLFVAVRLLALTRSPSPARPRLPELYVAHDTSSQSVYDCRNRESYCAAAQLQLYPDSSLIKKYLGLLS